MDFFVEFMLGLRVKKSMRSAAGHVNQSTQRNNIVDGSYYVKIRNVFTMDGPSLGVGRITVLPLFH